MKIKSTFAVMTAALISTLLLSCKPEPQPVPPEDDGKEDVKPGEDDEKKDPVAELELDGYAIFFQDRTSWGATHIYGWNSEAGSVTAAWPGNAVTGTVEIEEVSYKYVDMGSSLNDKTMKLISEHAGWI